MLQTVSYGTSGTIAEIGAPSLCRVTHTAEASRIKRGRGLRHTRSLQPGCSSQGWDELHLQSREETARRQAIVLAVLGGHDLCHHLQRHSLEL